MSAFAEKVKTARSELGMTQGELGEAVGVSLRTILDYEKGKKKPRQSTLLKLAGALKVSSRFLTDDSCHDPLMDIDRDGYIEEARQRYGSAGVQDMKALLDANSAFFAGGSISQEQKDAFFEAVMTAYVMSKEAAKEKFGRKEI